jgi:Cdc6-like AAA superfamily ATPase
MADDDVPPHVRESLERAREALAARHAGGVAEPEVDADEDIDPEKLAELRRHGHERLQEERWRIVCPSRFQWARVDQLGEHQAEVVQWSADPRGRNLVVLGPVGTGKTHLAAAALRAAFDRSLSTAFTPVGEMLDRLDWRDPASGEFMVGVLAMDRLVIDDLGSERGNEWTGERLYLVINRRWLDERPTIVTSNLSPRDLKDALSERTYSRLMGGAVVLHLTGDDRRRQA